MPWARFDDRFPSNRKVRPMSDGAFRLYVSAICWSAENLTDGVIKTAELGLVADVRSARTRAVELTNCGLWEPIPGVGWRIHDYHDYNPTADQVRADRKAKTARQQRWREKNAQRGDRSPTSNVDASTDASRDAPHDASRDAAPRARVPDPTRPAPTRPEREKKAEARTDPAQDALSLIPLDWQPSIDDVRTAQAARTAAYQPTLTGSQLADVTRKFVRRQATDKRLLSPDGWSARWQEWAERERPTDTGQPPLLLGLDGGLGGPAWPHEMPNRGPLTATAPQPLQTCPDCDRAFRGPAAGLCADCRQPQQHTDTA